MVMELYMLLYKETTEIFSRKFRCNYPKSMVEVVNHLYVLPESEKKRDTIILEK